MKRWLIAGLIAVALLLAIAASLLQSSWFADRVAIRIQQEVFRATGAKVTIGKLAIDWWRLHVQTGPLVVHGTEPQNTPPLFTCRNVDVGLKVTSFLRRMVDVASVQIESPRVNMIVYPDGSTNIPGQSGGDTPFAEHLIDLAVGHFEVRDGMLAVNDRKTPLNIRAERVRAVVDYSLLSQSYKGTISIGETTAAGVTASIDTQLELKRARLDVQSFLIKTANSNAEGSGSIEDWKAPRAIFDADVAVDVKEAAQLAKMPEFREGNIEGPLRVVYLSGEGLKINGSLKARRLYATFAGERFDNVNANATVSWDGTSAKAESLSASLWGGVFQGRAEWASSGAYTLEGTLNDIAAPHDVSTKASGKIKVAGQGPQLQMATGDLTLTPGTGAVPVGGSVAFDFDQRRNTLSLRPSTLTIRGSRVDLSGDLQRGLAFDLQTRDLGELLPALRLVSEETPTELPVQLEGGLLHVRGTARGPSTAPQVSATASAERLRYEDRVFTAVQATGDIASNRLHLTQFRFNYSGAAIAGSGEAALSDWRVTEQSPLSAKLNLQNVQLADIAKETSWKGQASGVLNGRVDITGTLGKPELEGSARLEKPSVDGYSVDSAAGAFAWRNGTLAVTSGQLARNGERLIFSGTYKPDVNDFRKGDVALEAQTAKIQLAATNPLNQAITLSGNVRARARVREGGADFSELAGNLEATGEKGARANLKAASSGNNLSLTGSAAVSGATMTLDSQWRLVPGLPGSGTMTLKNLTASAIQSIVQENPTELPFTAVIEGKADVEGRLVDPNGLAVRAVLNTVRLAPKRDAGAGLSIEDLTLRNDGDVVFTAGAGGAVIERARFVAKDTEIAGTGNISVRRANMFNLLLKGRLNLAIFSTFRPDLISSGVATTSVRIRGTPKEPQLDGRMDLKGASFYLRNVANGLDKVNGSVLFDTNRASIETLTAETGGGTVRMAGFIGFGTDLTYQLQAQTDRVRIRYPEGMSTQTNAQLTLTGTSRRSLLSGNITILRATMGEAAGATALFTSSSSKPLAVGETSNDFLKNMQFDIKVETSQSAEFATQLTKDVQADVNLTIRGTAERPSVLGRVSVTQGGVQFFGTDYTITRGEVNFVNPVRVDPLIDLDLETRVRGIVVSINFSGPMNKLNMTYRSDPPLQSSEIIGLLALGRTPTTGTQTGVSGIRTQDLFGGAGGSAILSSAMKAPSSGALQRFFGITRVKIDPQLIGLDNTPQARLSFEQQISRDVSVTYLTSLNRAQYQLVRVQWDLSRQWSAIATRDENGILSIDFVFKKSFK